MYNNNYFIIIIIILLIIYYYNKYNIKENSDALASATIVDDPIELINIKDTVDIKSVALNKIKFEYEQTKLNQLNCPDDLKKFCRINGKYKIHKTNPKEANEVNCHAYGIVPIFCNIDGIDKNGEVRSSAHETCTLTPEKSNENIIPILHKKIPVQVCSTYRCKPDYRLSKQTDGGLCIHNENNTKCSLDPLRTSGHDLCNKRELYKKYENTKYENNGDNNITDTIPDSSVEECANKCNKNSVYYATNEDYEQTLKFTIDKIDPIDPNELLETSTKQDGNSIFTNNKYYKNHGNIYFINNQITKPAKYDLSNATEGDVTKISYFTYKGEYYKYELTPPKYKNKIQFWSEETATFNPNKNNNFKIIKLHDTKKTNLITRISEESSDSYLYIGVTSNLDIKKINNNIINDEYEQNNNWTCVLIGDENDNNDEWICIKINNELSKICEQTKKKKKNGYNICETGIKTCPDGLRKYCQKQFGTNKQIVAHNSMVGNPPKLVNCDIPDNNLITFCEIENNNLGKANYLGTADKLINTGHFTKQIKNSKTARSCYLTFPKEPESIPVRVDQEINDYSGELIGTDVETPMPRCKAQDICYIYDEEECDKVIINGRETSECVPGPPGLTKCNTRNDCQYFTFNKINKQCKMKKSIYYPPMNDKERYIRGDFTTDTYMKLPLNYTEIKQADLIGDTLETYPGNNSTDHKTIEECARICNIYPECNTFTYGTGISNAGKCELRNDKDNEKDETSQNYVVNASTSIFKKNTIYKPFNKNTNTPIEVSSTISEYLKENKNISPNSIGNLCTLNDELANDEIKLEITKSNQIYKSNLINKYEKTENKKKNMENGIKETVMKNTVKFMIDKKSTITWDNINIECNEVYFELLATRRLILPYIQIYIEHNKEIVNVFGEDKTRTPISSNRLDRFKKTVLKFDESAYSKNDKSKDNITLDHTNFTALMRKNGFYIPKGHNMENNIGNSYNKSDLNICYITKNVENPIVKFTFYDGAFDRRQQIKKIKIKKIIIYNKTFGNNDAILPIKIGLKNSYQSFSDIKYVIKDTWDNELIESKSLPNVPKGLSVKSYRNLKVIKNDDNMKKVKEINNIGDISKIREWVDLNNTGKKDVYCSFTTDTNLRCIDSTKNATEDNASIIYSMNKFNPTDYPNSHYFEKINDDLHFCRCAKDSSYENALYTNVYCHNMDPNPKSKTRGTDTIQINKPSNCENYTGEMLKTLNINSSPMDREKCVNYRDLSTDKYYLEVEKNTIDAAFSIDKEIYIFKNTKLNNTNLVIFSIINNNNTKKNKTNFRIFNNNSFPDLNDIFYRQIDACYCIDNIIYFFSIQFICKFDLINNTVIKFENGNNYKTIQEYYFSDNSVNPNIFLKNLTAVVPKSKDIILFFKGTNYIEYNIKIKNNIKILNLKLDIKDNINLSNINAIFKINNIIYIINKNLHCKFNILTNQQEIRYGWKKNNIQKSIFNPNNKQNIWSYKINLLF